MFPPILDSLREEWKKGSATNPAGGFSCELCDFVERSAVGGCLTRDENSLEKGLIFGNIDLLRK